MLARRAQTWAPGPAGPLLIDSAVHVWRANLATVDDELISVLVREERERAARIARERERVLWRRSRGVLRALLARYLSVKPGALHIALGPNGKPELLGDPLYFNVSHSGEIALYALARSGPVGIDVQLARPIDAARARDHVALARRALGAEPARRLALLEEPQREREFLRLWTRYEAELKRRGTGIGGANSSDLGDVGWIGRLFLTDHLLAFEITSIVLLVAAVGGVILGSHTRRASA